MTTPSLQEQLKAAIAKMEERKSKINPESYECIEYDNLDGAIKFGKQVLSMIDQTAKNFEALRPYLVESEAENHYGAIYRDDALALLIKKE